MLMVIVAMLVLPGIDAIAKWLSGSVSSGQITWSRFFFQTLFMAPFALLASGPWFGPMLKLHLARGALIAMATLCFFSGLKYLPIADAIAIFFIEPLLVTLLSAVILGEAIHWRRITAITIGFIGALIVIRPAFDEVGPAALFPIGAAIFFSCYIILTRKLAHHEHPAKMQFLSGLSGALVMGVVLLVANIGSETIGQGDGGPMLGITWPSLYEWGLLAMLGFIATVCHLLVVYAYQRAVVSILAPFQYVEIISATVLGLVFFNDFPDLVTWFGISIIIGSGIYVFHRESQISKSAQPDQS